MSADGLRTVDEAVPAPAPGRRRRPGRHLRPVTRPTPRRSPAVPVLVGTGIVLVALFGLAVIHALLIGGQLRLDDMQREVASETEEIRQLRLRVAELESPDRVLDVARARLGMVEAADVGYLLPVEVDTGDDELVRVDAAEPPAPVQPEIDAATSEERAARDDVDPDASDPERTAADAVVAADGTVGDEPVDHGPGAGGDDE